MVDVLDALEPGQSAIMDMVGLVVEDGELIDIPDDLAQVHVAVVGLARGLVPKRGQEIVPQIVVFQR
jgi:hypothetical protein